MSQHPARAKIDRIEHLGHVVAELASRMARHHDEQVTRNAIGRDVAYPDDAKLVADAAVEIEQLASELQSGVTTLEDCQRGKRGEQ